LTAIIQYHSYFELNKNITVFFPYSTNLFYLWEWYKQMIWESLGKWWIWVTLTSAIWVTDQHSQLQLYYDWPNDKLITFLEVEDFWVDFKIDKENKLSFKNLLDNSKYWTEESISSYNKINYTIKIDKINEETLWELIAMLEVQTAILWEFYGFNPFDQPWVEIGKNITRRKIKENFGEIKF
jgi:glucose-6-phosphate isomerase